MQKRKNQEGQILLLIVLIIATVLSVGGAILFESLTQKKITKLQEESARALATAESLAEKALLQESDVTLSSSLPGAEGFQGEAKLITTSSSEFKTPLLFRDEYYTFYLTNLGSNSTQIRNKLRNPDNNSRVSLNLKLEVDNISDFGNTCPNKMALELAFLDIEDKKVTYRFIDCSSGYDLIFDPTDSRKISMGSFFNTPEAHLMIIRVMYKKDNAGDVFPGLILKITRNSDNLPLQGIRAKSTVRTPGGVTQDITLFKSYPQLPGSFFVTSINEYWY